jgi:hypothetical protein
MSFIDSILGRAPTAENTPAPQPTQVAQPTQRQPDPQPINPLDAYAKMFDNQTNEEGPPSFSIDDNVLNDVSSKLNFMSGVDTSLVQRATQGDAQAMIDLMQAVSQKAYQSALKHSTALTDVHLNRRGEFEKSNVTKNVKDTLTNEALSTIPNSSHPVVKAELRRIAENLARQNPDAAASEIAKEAQKYFATVYNAISPQTQPEQQQKAGEVQDWESFLNG